MATKGRILIADDRENNRNCLRECIEYFFPNYSIELCEDGRVLDGLLRENSDRINLVITDNDMPGFTGIDIIRRYASKGIPIVLCYAGDREVGREALKHGAFGIIEKPYSINDVLGIVGRVLTH